MVVKYVVDGNVSDMVSLLVRAVAGVKLNRSSTLVEDAIKVGNNVRGLRAVTAPASTKVDMQQPSSTMAPMTIIVRSKR